jgi:hypothetical protein
MADTKDAVEFYWDPVCPWCWITSRWMADVGRHKAIEVDWRFFSLRKINEGRELPERFRVSHLMGLRANAVAKAGKDVGVPLIVLDGGTGPGFFGPVFSPAPTGKAAVELWDAMVTAGRTEGFYEFKRTRTTGPIFGERPTA